MSNQALIRLDWQAQAAAMTEAATALKEEALTAAAYVAKVNDASTQEAAVQAQQKLAGILALVEKARKAAKEPALEFGRRIDDAARLFSTDLKEEQLRLATIVGDFQALEAAKARAAELLRIAEERKAQEERRLAELAAIRAAEAEKQKLAEAERAIAAQAAASKSKRESELLAQQQAEINRQRALSEAASHAELDRINKSHSDAMAAIAERPKYEPVRAAGQRVQEDWEITVSDIWLLAKAHPSCVRIEPLPGEIKTLIKAGVKVAGVVAKPIVKAGVSRGRQVAAIDV